MIGLGKSGPLTVLVMPIPSILYRLGDNRTVYGDISWNTDDLSSNAQENFVFKRLSVTLASQAALVVKNPSANARDTREAGSIPGEGNGTPLQGSCWKIPGQRSLADCSPQGHKELDAAEQLSAHTQVTENLQGLDRQPASSETQRRWLTPLVVSE